MILILALRLCWGSIPTGHQHARKSRICSMAAGRMGATIPGKQVQKGTESLAESLGLDAVRVPSGAQIAHILDGKRADGEPLAEKVAGTARSRFLELYGVPREREAFGEELAQIRVGRRADGTEQRLGPLSQGLAASRARIGYVDLCWSADKSVSLAWAFTPTEAERNIIVQAHRDAVSSALLYVEAEIGQARKGKAGRGGAEPGQIGLGAVRPLCEPADSGGSAHRSSDRRGLYRAGDAEGCR